MIRRLSILMLLMAIITLSACQSSNELKPLREESIDYDMNTAYEMIEMREKMIIDLSMRDKISRAEYEQLEASFAEAFGSHAHDILAMLLINNMDADPGSDIMVQHNALYPTVLHEGVTITSAVVYKSYYENDFFNQTRLSIREEYNGDREALKDWSRAYIFTMNDNGEWELTGFSGVMNFLGEDYHMRYLPLNDTTK